MNTDKKPQDSDSYTNSEIESLLAELNELRNSRVWHLGRRLVGAMEKLCPRGSLRRSILKHILTRTSRYTYTRNTPSTVKSPLDSDTKVSVVVPNYNYALYLPERLDSILNQTYPLYELIILDDASTDNSLAIIEEYVAVFPFIKVYKNAKNSGNLFKQWEKGFALATGEYVWIAEADDVADVRFLETILERMNNETVLAYCESKAIDAAGKLLHDTYKFYTSSVSLSHWDADYESDAREEVRRYLTVANTIPTVSSVVLKNIGLCKAVELSSQYRLSGDWIFYINLLSEGRISFVSEPLNLHRLHQASLGARTKFCEYIDELLRVQEYAAIKVNNGVRSHAACRYFERRKDLL